MSASGGRFRNDTARRLVVVAAILPRLPLASTPQPFPPAAQSPERLADGVALKWASVGSRSARAGTTSCAWSTRRLAPSSRASRS